MTPLSLDRYMSEANSGKRKGELITQTRQWYVEAVRGDTAGDPLKLWFQELAKGAFTGQIPPCLQQVRCWLGQMGPRWGCWAMLQHGCMGAKTACNAPADCLCP